MNSGRLTEQGAVLIRWDKYSSFRHGSPESRLHGRRGLASSNLYIGWFPSSDSRRYTQALKAHHFGMDAEIQRPRTANFGSQQMPLYLRTGNYGLASHLNQALAQSSGYRPWPGFRHPCRNDGFLAGSQAPAWEPLSCKLLLGRSSGSRSFKNPITKHELWNEQKISKIMNLTECDRLFERIRRSCDPDELRLCYHRLFEFYPLINYQIGRGSIFWRGRKSPANGYEFTWELHCPTPEKTNIGRLNNKSEPCLQRFQHQRVT